MTKRIAYLLILTVLSFSFNSCGVMFGGSKYNGRISVEDHPKAKIYVNGELAGTGTAVGSYKRKDPLVVEVQQDGCETQTQTFDNTLRAGNFLLSAFSWGLLGIVIDIASGASFKPNHASNPDIEKVNDKNFNFYINLYDCEE
ncbi:MAG: hypothetical protein AAFN93_07925 [Bacteroidota bacterium]